MVAILLCSVSADQNNPEEVPKNDTVQSGDQGFEKGELNNTQQEVNSDETQQAEGKQEDTNKEVKEETNKEEDSKQEETKQEETKKEETKQEETKKEEIKEEEVKQEEVKEQEIKQEEIKQEENKEEEQKQEKSKKEIQQEETIKEEVEIERDKFEKDDNSYAFKGTGDVWRLTEENERSMLDYLTAWANHISRINSLTLNYELTAGSTLTFYEDIKKVPQRLNGVYSAPGEKANSILITIMDPYKNIILLKSGVKDLIFYPELKTPGRYTIQLINNNVIFPHPLVFCKRRVDIRICTRISRYKGKSNPYNP